MRILTPVWNGEPSLGGNEARQMPPLSLQGLGTYPRSANCPTFPPKPPGAFPAFGNFTVPAGVTWTGSPGGRQPSECFGIPSRACPHSEPSARRYPAFTRAIVPELVTFMNTCFSLYNHLWLGNISQPSVFSRQHGSPGSNYATDSRSEFTMLSPNVLMFPVLVNAVFQADLQGNRESRVRQ